MYLDTSALIKRVVEEPESSALVDALDEHVGKGVVLVSSSLARIEVSRAMRKLADRGHLSIEEAWDFVDVALSGVMEKPISADVMSLGRRVEPSGLRTLDAIHLATALVLDVREVVVYDRRLAEGCRHNGLKVSTP